MKKTLILLILFLFILTSCQKETTYTRFQESTSQVGFDTTIELMAYTHSQEEFNKYMELLKTSFIEYNQIFDKYNDYEGVNNLKTINDHAGLEPVEVDQRLIDVLLISKSEFDDNYGKFDPTMGSVLTIWHDYREEGILLNADDEYGEIPPLDLLQQADTCTGWDLVEIDDEKNTVYLNKPCASLDLGGIAKGYAVEEITKILKEAGLEYFSLNAGGNIKVAHAKPDNKPWNIAIAEPTLFQLNHVDVFSIDKEMAVVTSGDYQRNYLAQNDQLMHHLIDPETLMPLHYYRSATIVTPNSTFADMYSTVLYLLDYNQGNQWLKEHNEKHPEHPLEAFWIVDQSNELFNHPDFIQVPEKPYKISMTDGLKELSWLMNP